MNVPALPGCDILVCRSIEDARPSDSALLTCHDCDELLVDSTIPREIRAVCMRCYGARMTGGRA